MDLINYIREKQNELVLMINSTFDEIVKEVEKNHSEKEYYEKEYETTYPITSPSSFKGKKPIAVLFNEERVITSTWKNVVKTILQRVITDEIMKKKLQALSDKLLGRVRKRLSNTSEDMRSPIEICDGLYIETHYDTIMLMDLLLQILNEINYDYSNIKIVIKN